ncbi:hypothetical protein SDRG_15699 [Saprolegnia diclina VS20]|uniref:Uncharacterized protein n=1 Tax=Saprolegnia diclina (strain VS20) TaxID=1156394 RepID=T0PM69_SAPDV|nr:hypothetical protein SDRG_15699 [Saprolegnia diclina VS20]EQC26454.1 hypothetical protein SDRG_15699 [Saprolegnia diclina VS20]|eukprot:XP_008620100.1 hypothetical protein SDRG_15699 [Saprolegnia diclina VS20]
MGLIATHLLRACVGRWRRIELKGHVGDVTTVNFFPSSRVALTGSADFRLRIWSMEAFRCAAVLEGHVGAVTGSGILGKGRNVVCT